MLEEKGENNIEIRSNMINNLIILINKLQEETHEVILTIDTNESFDSGQGRVEKLIYRTKRVDPISCTHGLKHIPNTHQRRKKTNIFYLRIPQTVQVHSSLRNYPV